MPRDNKIPWQPKEFMRDEAPDPQHPFGSQTWQEKHAHISGLLAQAQVAIEQRKTQ